MFTNCLNCQCAQIILGQQLLKQQFQHISQLDRISLICFLILKEVNIPMYFHTVQLQTAVLCLAFIYSQFVFRGPNLHFFFFSLSPFSFQSLLSTFHLSSLFLSTIAHRSISRVPQVYYMSPSSKICRGKKTLLRVEGETCELCVQPCFVLLALIPQQLTSGSLPFLFFSFIFFIQKFIGL